MGLRPKVALGICFAVQMQQLRHERRPGVNPNTLPQKLLQHFGAGTVYKTKT